MESIAGENILELYQTSTFINPGLNNLFLYNKENEALMIRYPDGSDFPIHTPNNKTICVSKNGNARFQTVKEAVDFAVANGNGYEIDVQPGVYIEDNPINLGNGNTLHSKSGPFITTIVALNSNANLIEIGGNCFIKAIRLVGSTGGAAIYHNQALGNSAVTESIISNCYTGIETSGFPGTLMLFDTQIACDATNNVNRGLFVHDGGEIYGSTVVISGHPANLMNYGIYCEGSFSSGPFFRRSLVYLAVGTTNYSNTGIYVNNNARIKYNSSSTRQTGMAIHVGPDGVCDMLLRSVDLLENTMDLYIEATAVKFTGNGLELDPAKIFNAHNVEINIISYSNALEEEGMYVYGNFNIGEPAIPTKSQFGEGGNYTRSLCVLQNTNNEVGIWSEETTAAKLLTNPSFNLFVNTDSDSCTYIGSDYAFSGIEATINAVGTENDATNRVWEIWNGTASPPSWEEIKIMVTFYDKPYTSKANIFGTILGTTNVRFGFNTTLMKAYGKKTLNGIEKYWIRIRSTSNQTSNPVIQKIRIHSNHQKISVIGFSEYFGDSRPIEKLLLDYRLGIFDSDASAITEDTDIYLSDNLYLKRKQNYFAYGLKRRLNMSSSVPQNIDTSFGIKFSWQILCDSDSTGDIYWTLRWGKSSTDTNLYFNSGDAPTISTFEKVKTITQNIPANSSNKKITTHTYIDISNMNFRNDNDNDNDILWISFERTGDNVSDTFSGNVGCLDIYGLYIKWCTGGYIDTF